MANQNDQDGVARIPVYDESFQTTDNQLGGQSGNLGFVPSSQVDPDSISGDMYSHRSNQFSDHGFESSGNTSRASGHVADFLNKRGFGWLMEVQQESDDEYQRPLL